MKKIICLALVLIMTLSFVACDKEDILTKSEGVMTWEEYNAAALNDEVTIEAYVQGKQSWWSDNGVGKATIYLQDGVGGYLLYDLHCSEEEYGKLVEGTKVRVTGYKAAYKGEYEIIDATFEIIEGNYVCAYYLKTKNIYQTCERAKSCVKNNYSEYNPFYMLYTDTDLNLSAIALKEIKETITTIRVSLSTAQKAYADADLDAIEKLLQN